MRFNKRYSEFLANLKEEKVYKTSEDNKTVFLSRFNVARELGFYVEFVGTIIKSGIVSYLGRWSADSSSKLSFSVLEIAEKYGMRFNIEGLNNLDTKSQPVYSFVSNHMSALETQILSVLLKPFTPVSFVIKSSLLRIPFLGSILKQMKAIPLGRKNPMKDFATLFDLSKQRAKEGRSVIIFPEGKRYNIFNSDNFGGIGIKMAQKTHTICIPVAIKTDAWGVGKWIRDFGKIDPKKMVHIAFGPQLLEGTSKEKLDLCTDFIANKLADWNLVSQPIPTSIS